MSDDSLIERRLLAILERKRPDMSEAERTEVAETFAGLLAGEADLTWFWRGVYGVGLTGEELVNV